jgi:hypothetical protein
MIVSIS